MDRSAKWIVAAVVWDKYFCFPQVACGGQREGDGGVVRDVWMDRGHKEKLCLCCAWPIG